jgi:hypothetical protein
MNPFQKGDKAYVSLKPIKVTICKARPYWEDYYCRKCNCHIKMNSLYGRSYDGYKFCLNCCKEI